MRASDRDDCENKDSIADIAEKIAEPEADGEQTPEGNIAPPFGVRCIARASNCEAGEYRAGEDVKPVQVDHMRRPNFRSRSSSRVPWIRKAQIALGIAQTDSWKGVSWIPKFSSEA